MNRSRIITIFPQILMCLWGVAVMLTAGPGIVRDARALAATDCTTCHTGSTYGSIPQQHHAVASSKGITCLQCHRAIPDGSGGFTIEVITDCIVCHGQVDHAAAHNMVATAADCAQCHTQTPVAEHLSRTSSCSTCHSSTAPAVQKAITDGRAGVMVNCITCHGAVNHIVQHDRAFPSPDCVQCHAQGVVFEHLNRTSTCATCHASTQPAVQKAIADGRAGIAVYCVTCHGTVNHVLQHDKVSTPADCSGCHNQGPVQEHTNRTSTCATCHNSSSTTVQQTITLGRTGTMVSCANCHGAVNHIQQHDKAMANADCAQCHNLGVVNEHLSRASTCATCHSSAAPAVQQAIAAGKAGTTVYCSNCHANVNHVQQHDKVTTPADCASCHGQGVVYEHTNRSSTCATCHNSTNAAVQKTISDGRAGITVSCASCHGAVNHVAQHDQALASPACAQCHTKSVLDEHLTRTSTCATCHSSSSTAVQQAIAAGRSGQAVSCVDCHGQVTHQSAHDGKVLVPYGDCSSCHIPNLVELHAVKGFQCAACHASDNASVTAAVQKGLGGTLVYCADCHSAIGGFGNHAGQHDMVGLPAPNCGQCHSDNAVTAHEKAATPVYCNGCHTSTNELYVKTISDGMAGIQQNCRSCHTMIHGGANRGPSANAGADRTVTVGQAITFSGSGSSDPDGSIVGYVWNFGDGTTGSGVSVTKTYTTAGTYTVTLTVTDNSGDTASDTAVVTVQSQAGSSSVFADQVLYLQRLSSVTSSDSNSNDLTSKFRDSNLADRYLLQYKSGENYVIAMKLNRDALTASKVVLRLYVSSISSSRTLRIYPYQSNGTSVNSYYSVSYSTSSAGWKDIDVTSIAQRMNGYGWMKFRVTTTSSSLYVAEGAFLVQ
ncbi:cytochrome C [Geobacter sulfurreducens]|nr:cytochrome C [Geobacter sulfurreducens]